jgi:3-hydroxybutyryl-CoA dehydrogenase
MTIVIVAGKEQKAALNCNDTNIVWMDPADHFSFDAYTTADAFIFLSGNGYNFSATAKPVFINSVVTTLSELHAGDNVLRINGWPTFLERPVWEVAGRIDEAAAILLEKINKKILWVKDEPGLIAAKIISMIINEAYFALGDEVSSKKEIDTAMKLGTNYPYGPFEWAEKIGIPDIVNLLQQLSVTDKRYMPAPKLLDIIQEHS